MGVALYTAVIGVGIRSIARLGVGGFVVVLLASF